MLSNRTDIVLWSIIFQKSANIKFFIAKFRLKLLIGKFRLKLKKVGKTTRQFIYDLNQISNDYTVEVTNIFKGLDLIECLKNYGQRFIILYRRQ